MTRQVFNEVEVTFDGLFAREQIPPWAKSGYEQVKSMIKKYCNLEQRARENQAAAQAATQDE